MLFACKLLSLSLSLPSLHLIHKDLNKLNSLYFSMHLYVYVCIPREREERKNKTIGPFLTI